MNSKFLSVYSVGQAEQLQVMISPTFVPSKFEQHPSSEKKKGLFSDETVIRWPRAFDHLQVAGSFDDVSCVVA
jgi:hypothetical protein